MSLYEAAVEQARIWIWTDALEAADGNITRAARALGLTKKRGIALNRRHGLAEYARGLRVRAGVPARGRPPGVRAGIPA